MLVAAGGAEEKGVLGCIRTHEGEAVDPPSNEPRNDKGDEEVEPEGPHVRDEALAEALVVVAAAAARAVGPVVCTKAARGEEGRYAEDVGTSAYVCESAERRERGERKGEVG